MLNECYYTKGCLFHIAKWLPEHTITRLTRRPCRLPRRNSSPKENETIMLGLTLWRRQRDFPRSLHRFNPWPRSTGGTNVAIDVPPHPGELWKISVQAGETGVLPTSSLVTLSHPLTGFDALQMISFPPPWGNARNKLLWKGCTVVLGRSNQDLKCFYFPGVFHFHSNCHFLNEDKWRKHQVKKPVSLQVKTIRLCSASAKVLPCMLSPW